MSGASGRRTRWLFALWPLFAACGSSDPTAPDVEVPLRLEPRGPAGNLPEDVSKTAPAENPLTVAKATLGRSLFFDVRLSRTGTVACVSCHDPKHAFADPRRVSVGVEGREGVRNAPSLANLAWVRTGLFWDGRAANLELQVKEPISDPLEMDLPLEEAVARLQQDTGMVRDFEAAFGGPPSKQNLPQALASFVRSLVSAGSRYDAYSRGDAEALTQEEKAGLGLFFGTKAGCFHCHTEGTLTNQGFFNNGTFVEGGDVGRQKVTGRTGDRGAFRVPTLRNVAVTAPYMHDGSIQSLEEVLDHYQAGGRGGATTNPLIHPFTLTSEEREQLLAFLRALTDEAFLEDARYRAR